nr:uncharacterized protein LOC105644870 [Ipomoea batatas]GMD18747.1 uncharacterized protein LOC105644870 [Ipomoea batatas]GMD20179.1 uncharacterized protein LOC105644870 [Ipomoea batatas]
MLKRSGVTVSFLPNSAVMTGWCRPRRRAMRRRKGSAIRLGKRRGRGFCLGSRTAAVHWGVVMACPFRLLKKIVMQLVANGRLVEAYYWSLPFLRPQLFPLC